MDRYILGISGSPRIAGNTDILLDKALEGARDSGAKTEKIVLNDLKFAPCQECSQMPGDGTCIIEDDMQVVYKKVKEADGIILASPIFFGSLSAQTKMMIDRFQCLWRARYLLKKDTGKRKMPGAFISVEASTRDGFFENAKSIVRNFFAAIDVEYKGELLCPGVDEKGSVFKHPDFLKMAFELGKDITAIARKL